MLSKGVDKAEGHVGSKLALRCTTGLFMIWIGRHGIGVGRLDPISPGKALTGGGKVEAHYTLCNCWNMAQN